MIFPAVHWMDDSCGLVSHWVAAYKEEYEVLFGANRGCPKEWKKGDEIDLTPVRRALRRASIIRRRAGTERKGQRKTFAIRDLLASPYSDTWCPTAT